MNVVWFLYFAVVFVFVSVVVGVVCSSFPFHGVGFIGVVCVLAYCLL